MWLQIHSIKKLPNWQRCKFFMLWKCNHVWLQIFYDVKLPLNIFLSNSINFTIFSWNFLFLYRCKSILQFGKFFMIWICSHTWLQIYSIKNLPINFTEKIMVSINNLQPRVAANFLWYEITNAFFIVFCNGNIFTMNW